MHGCSGGLSGATAPPLVHPCPSLLPTLVSHRKKNSHLIQAVFIFFLHLRWMYLKRALEDELVIYGGFNLSEQWLSFTSCKVSTFPSRLPSFCPWSIFCITLPRSSLPRLHFLLIDAVWGCRPRPSELQIYPAAHVTNRGAQSSQNSPNSNWWKGAQVVVTKDQFWQQNEALLALCEHPSFNESPTQNLLLDAFQQSFWHWTLLTCCFETIIPS